MLATHRIRTLHPICAGTRRTACLPTPSPRGADRLATNVCYCSTLGECWVYSEVSALEPGSTRPTDECAPDPVPFRAATHETLAALQASVVARLKDAGAPD